MNLEIISEKDKEFIYALVNSKGWLEFIGDRKVYSKNDAKNYINKILNTENLFYWVLRIKESNVPVGMISFLKRGYLEHFDIGFAMLPEFQGLGYAHEGASEVLRIVSDCAKFNPVLATTLVSNKQSIKLLTKLGFNFQSEVEVENQKLSIYSNKK